MENKETLTIPISSFGIPLHEMKEIVAMQNEKLDDVEWVIDGDNVILRSK